LNQFIIDIQKLKNENLVLNDSISRIHKENKLSLEMKIQVTFFSFSPFFKKKLFNNYFFFFFSIQIEDDLSNQIAQLQEKLKILELENDQLKDDYEQISNDYQTSTTSIKEYNSNMMKLLQINQPSTNRSNADVTNLNNT